jgi:peptide/nickel transport system permease protein
MGAFILRRIWQSLILIVGVSVIGYALMFLAPGGPLAVYTLNPGVTAEDIERIERVMGLDRPFHIQYLNWAGGLLTGNWGTSFFAGRPVSDLVLERLPATLLLMGTSVAAAVMIGTAVGTLGAFRRYSVFDYLATTGAMVALSLPTFWFGLVAIYIFAVNLGWFPAGGIRTMGSAGGGLADLAYHLVLPASVLTFVLVGQWSRYARSAVLEVLTQEYIRAARAKGLNRFTILFRHAMRGALGPLVTLLGLQIPLLFGGALVLETVFSWPGMGLLFVSSLSTRDYPVLMGILMLSAVSVVIGNLLADLINALIDPRVKLRPSQ